jgi:hypothetical protein
MRYAFVYGGLGGLIVISIMVATFAFNLTGHVHSLWFGYLVMLVGLTMIFVGTKRYRDTQCGGVIGFGRAFGLGVATAAVAICAPTAPRRPRSRPSRRRCARWPRCTPIR